MSIEPKLMDSLTFHELLTAKYDFELQEDAYRPLRAKYADVFHALQDLQSQVSKHMPTLLPELDNLRRRAQKFVAEEAGYLE